MTKIAIIGYGAIARYVQAALPLAGASIAYVIARKNREAAARESMGQNTRIETSYHPADLVIDCAGHSGLHAHGETVLRAGCPLLTLSLGALADAEFAERLEQAAQTGNTRLHLASGAIGGLDALAAAATGDIAQVTYTGRKPPQGWRGSPAEDVLDLGRLDKPVTHFTGSARNAALQYPKNANVAAAVALAGIGFDKTQVRLIADPTVSGNIHQITASGAFGEFSFEITGKALPDNPRSSALAAMSLVKKLRDQTAQVLL